MNIHTANGAMLCNMKIDGWPKSSDARAESAGRCTAGLHSFFEFKEYLHCFRDRSTARGLHALDPRLYTPGQSPKPL